MADSAALSPLLEQYEGVKARYPGHLVLFRVGDFYETFGDDAKLLAKELEVVLTARAPDGRGDRTPMAGVPHHAVESYLGRLVQKGYKVALCDQVEDARFAKGLVRREVTRVVTPGTVLEERILPGADHNFLAAVRWEERGPSAYAACDITTGELFFGPVESGGLDRLLSALAPFSPREILLDARSSESVSKLETAVHREFPSARLDRAPEPMATDELPTLLAPLGRSGGPVGEVTSRLAAYVRATQPRLLPFLEPLERTAGVRRLILDPKTLRHLEISRPMNPDDPGGLTLIGTWDESVTAPGRRALAFWLKNPLADVPAIRDRQDAVESLKERGAELLSLRQELAKVSDLSRIASRVAGRRVRPGELVSLRESLEALSSVRAWLGRAPLSPMAERLASRLDRLPELVDRLRSAIQEPVAVDADDPKLFRTGFSEELDRRRSGEEKALSELERLEKRESEASGIRSLKIGYNQVFGYYFEVTRPHLAKVPPHFRRKQTLQGAERFTTDRLAELETEILGARQSVGTLQAEVWESLLNEIDQCVPKLHRISRAIGELDALATFALVAQERGHIRPVVDESLLLQVRDGRHAVLDRTLSGRFVPNDTELDGANDRLLVLTGPNMSGKSTYMRQVGLLVVLAQAGAFVPAKFARIGVVSSLFTRMGFTDEIGRGKSSFMVEMSEVAEILRDSDERSLVLLDEVGRGTSTFDGLALAWATLRHLNDRLRCRTLLATHYHQLTELVEGLSGARNAHLAVAERGDDVAFLHRLVPGSTDRSLGVHVAKLAGMPPEVVAEATRLLKRLEAGGISLAPSGAARRRTTGYTQAMLLPAEALAPPSALEEALRSLDLDRMTPLEALAWLSDWRVRLAAPRDGAG
ncbi:MAG: DNA mismatch repair protein MutS [Thermoplasmata archaeon]|nr:DNA mismatch repair protein MutS [Thermoplasmata archaeon]